MLEALLSLHHMSQEDLPSNPMALFKAPASMPLQAFLHLTLYVLAATNSSLAQSFAAHFTINNSTLLQLALLGQLDGASAQEPKNPSAMEVCPLPIWLLHCRTHSVCFCRPCASS